MQRCPTAKAMSLVALAAALFFPAAAMAYIPPEEILMGNDLYVPPHSRDIKDAVERQAAKSTARRAEEWELEYERQHPTPPPAEEEEDVGARGGVPGEDKAVMLTNDAMELLRTIRLLERVDKQQSVIRHEGAPPLAPTGAPAAIAFMTILLAAGWTIIRAGRKRAWISKTIG